MKVINKLFIRLLMGVLMIAVPLHAQATSVKQQKWPSHLRILTGSAGGQWDILGNAISSALNYKLLSTCSKLGGGLANIDKIEQNLGDLGFSMSCFLADPEQQTKISPQKNTVLLANLYPQILYILLRKDFAERHQIDSLETLLQKKIPVRFATLKKGTGSYFLFDMLLQHGFNFSFQQLQKKGWQIIFNNYSEIADQFVDGRLDGFAYTAGSEVPLILNVEQYMDLVVLPVSPKVLGTLHSKLHTNTYTIKPGTYASITKPVTTLGTYTSLVVRKDLPTDLVYSINKIIWENRASIGKGMKDFSLFSPETALPRKIKAHSGSVKFWQELQSQR